MTPVQGELSVSQQLRILIILLATYVLSMVDRQVIGVLAVPIKADLHLTDTQLGLMGGLAFALFYTVLGVPIAWVADRKSRSVIIAISVALWSLFTALSGVVQNFTQLFLMRMGVGIGEAGGTAPAHSLISDFFPPHRRARALSVYLIGGPLGAAVGILFGGWMAANVDWRFAFLVLGGVGLLLAPVVLFGVPEPRRGQFDGPGSAEPAEQEGFIRSMVRLMSIPSFWYLSLCAALSGIPSQGMLFWLPSFLQRSYGMDLLEVSLFQGTLMLVGGVSGTWLSGWLSDRLGVRGKWVYGAIPAIAFTLAAPLYALALFAPGGVALWLMFLIPQTLGLMWFSPIVTATQHLVPPTMRATASANMLLINNLIGVGVGTFILGYLADLMNSTYGDHALRYSILYVLVMFLVAAVCGALAARRLERDWYRGRAAA